MGNELQPKTDCQFEDYAQLAGPEHVAFIEQVHALLLASGCPVKMQPAKNGYVVSYTHAQTKRVLANLVFRKNVPVVRIYGDHVNQYAEFMQTLPEGMVKAIGKAPVCKRLLDPATCNQRCPMGYDFTIHDARFQKCRYNSFMFEVNAENFPFISAFLANELQARNAGGSHG